jgi:hypothetical protein
LEVLDSLEDRDGLYSRRAGATSPQNPASAELDEAATAWLELASAVPSDNTTAIDKITGEKRAQARGNADDACSDCGHPFIGSSPVPVFAYSVRTAGRASGAHGSAETVPWTYVWPLEWEERFRLTLPSKSGSLTANSRRRRR